MKKKYTLSLHIFRRDLRLDDNTALVNALETSEQVIPCFIFDPRQVGSKNSYRSNNALQFMLESLQDLEQQCKKKQGRLYYFFGIAEKVVEKLLKTLPINAIFCNKDYTSFSIKRDEHINKACLKHNIPLHSFDDLLLTAPDQVKTQQGDPYSLFTPFFKKAFKQSITKPKKCKNNNFLVKPIMLACSFTSLKKKILPSPNKHIHVHGGRTKGLAIIKNLKKFKSYQSTRDYPAYATTNLSAHHKFGTVSLREVYHAMVKQLGSSHLLIQQLFWRDFFTHVAYYSPFVFGQPFHKKYEKLPWSTNKKHFKAWCTGTTGFPIVDAGMRQLNTTGFMHNRVRMIAASFLVKDLHINWLWGEHYFAQKLVDYDPAVNNGNWQWCASTGTDATPYFRIFNPWLQQKKFDPACTYIKTWVKELKAVKPAIIHAWHQQSQKITIKQYPAPIVDHKKEGAKAKALYKNVT